MQFKLLNLLFWFQMLVLNGTAFLTEAKINMCHYSLFITNYLFIHLFNYLHYLFWFSILDIYWVIENGVELNKMFTYRVQHMAYKGEVLHGTSNYLVVIMYTTHSLSFIKSVVSLTLICALDWRFLFVFLWMKFLWIYGLVKVCNSMSKVAF